MNNEHASHEEMKQDVANGHAVILSDETLPGGQIQVVCHRSAGVHVITQWRSPRAGVWESYASVWLNQEAIAKLVAFVRPS